MKYGAFSLILFIIPCLAWAQPAKNDGVDTLVGRGGKAAIVSNGQTREIDTGKLTIQNKALSRRALRPKEPPKAESKAVAESKTALTPEQRAKKEEQEKIRLQDIDRLRALQRQGAWFYTDDNKALPPAELEERLKAGDIADIKTVDIHLNEWMTQTEVEESKKSADGGKR